MIRLMPLTFNFAAKCEIKIEISDQDVYDELLNMKKEIYTKDGSDYDFLEDIKRLLHPEINSSFLKRFPNSIIGIPVVDELEWKSKTYKAGCLSIVEKNTYTETFKFVLIGKINIPAMLDDRNYEEILEDIRRSINCIDIQKVSNYFKHFKIKCVKFRKISIRYNDVEIQEVQYN